MSQQNETILQFGAGRFLRAFVDLFVHQANQQGQGVGSIAVVQSTGGERAGLLTKQNGRYHVAIRGYADGQVIDRVEEVGSISRALVAGEQWDDVLALARSPELQYVVSNTTEAGFALDPADTPRAKPPRSYPAKLLAILRERHAAGQPPLTVIPCELLEGQAGTLRQTVLDLGKAWNEDAGLLNWIGAECRFLHTLVDRIVSGTPQDHPLLATDPLLIMAEPYALFALERHADASFLTNPAVVRADDVRPYFLRKVRILNAAHTALVIKAGPAGHKLVREAVEDEAVRTWLERLLFEEIVPTLEGRVADGGAFARETIDRFRNPFLDHKFADIALHHESKVEIRLKSTRDEYRAKYDRDAPLLTELLKDA